MAAPLPVAPALGRAEAGMADALPVAAALGRAVAAALSSPASQPVPPSSPSVPAAWRRMKRKILKYLTF